MYRLKDPDLPTSIALAEARPTESIVQSPPTRTYFVKGKDNMAYEVEYTDEFDQCFITFDEKTQDDIFTALGLLKERGPNLPFPYSSRVNGSRHKHMRELRVQHQGEPYRILYAFDPGRTAILLLVGNKKGNDRWYQENIPKADKLYDQWLKS
jgi:hypothetical protein